MSRLQFPKVSDPPEAHADWLEWQSLIAPNQYVAWSDHQRDLRIGGLDESERETSNDLEVLVNDITSEIEGRVQACGGSEGTYPFRLTDQGMIHLSESDTSTYTFQLLLSLFGRKAGSSLIHGERLFEDLCAQALVRYLGGTQGGLQAFVFGFPRRVLPTGFRQAVDDLCRMLREGIGAKGVPELGDQKDANLDLVVWRGFPEGNPGQLIVFGQCATGMDWFQKIHELQTQKWCQLWLKELPLVSPLAAFFLPRRIEPLQWRRASVYGGILFDRCRISWLLPEISGPLGEQVRQWVQHVLAGEGRS